MEKTVSTLAVNIVLTKPAIDFMEFVTLDVKVDIMDKSVSKVSIYEYSTEICLFFKFCNTIHMYLLPLYIINFIYIKFQNFH